MTQQIKTAVASVKAFDKKNTNFSGFTYWLLFITASAVWLNSFNEVSAAMLLK